MSGVRVTVNSWVEPIGTVDSLYSLGGGQRISAATAPRECALVELPRALALVNGHGNADGLAGAYFDTADVAGWFVGRIARRLAEDEEISPGAAIEAASVEVLDYIRRENIAYCARGLSNTDGVTSCLRVSTPT